MLHNCLLRDLETKITYCIISFVQTDVNLGSSVGNYTVILLIELLRFTLVWTRHIKN